MHKTLAKLRDKQPITIVVVGDSNTIVSMNTQGHMNWVAYLTEALWERYGDGLVTMINVSECGYNYQRLADALDQKVLRWRPDLVICQLWLCDLQASGAEREVAKATFRDMVTRLREARSGDAELLVCTPNPHVFCFAHPLPEGARPGEVYEGPEWNSHKNDELVALAREAGCSVVDHFSAWKAKTYEFAHPGANPRGLWQRMIDPIHPNALGQLVLFREMAGTFDVAKHFPWEEEGA